MGCNKFRKSGTAGSQEKGANLQPFDRIELTRSPPMRAIAIPEKIMPLNEEAIINKLNKHVRSSIEETLNELLELEARY